MDDENRARMEGGRKFWFFAGIAIGFFVGFLVFASLAPCVP